MGSLMTPTTELFYAFINLDDTPVPRDLPEEDVFSRAFKQATIAQPDFRKKDITSFAELDTPQDSPQDLVFDEFPSKDPDESGDTSPSSDGSSSAKPFFNTPKYNTTATTTSSNPPPTRPGSLEIEPLDASGAVAGQLLSQFSGPNTGATRLEIHHEPQNYGLTITGNVPFFAANNILGHPGGKPPRRRNTKRKMRTEEEEAEKRRVFLERNRMAAQKCRSRKKRQTNTLEDDLAVQEEINTRLKGEVEELTAELRRLKEVYVLCEQECDHAKATQPAVDATSSEEVNQEVKEEAIEAMDVS